GIPQEDYDAVVAERDSVQAKVTSVQSELTGVQSELDNTKKDLASKESELATAKSDLASALTQIEGLESDVGSANSKASSANSKLSSANSELSALKQKMEKAETFAGVISSLFVPIMKGEDINALQVFISWTDSINAVDDPEVRRLFNETIASEGGDQELTALYLYIFETLPEILK
ncbi:hypothetical protein ACFLV6_03315, partial [Chloroflexota bacterium]